MCGTLRCREQAPQDLPDFAISFGICCVDDSSSAEDWLERADEDLMRQKQGGDAAGWHLNDERRASCSRLLVALLVFAFVLAGCSANRFLYNRADTFVRWAIDDYVDLTSEQQSNLMRTSMGCSIGTGATNYRFTESLSSRRWMHSRRSDHR